MIKQIKDLKKTASYTIEQLNKIDLGGRGAVLIEDANQLYTYGGVSKLGRDEFIRKFGDVDVGDISGNDYSGTVVHIGESNKLIPLEYIRRFFVVVEVKVK